MANQFEALIARIRQQPSWGFEHQHLKIPLDPGSLSGEKVEPIGIVWSPLSPVDYGLVPVAERIAYAPKLQSSRMTITPSGILQPVAPPTEKNKTPIPFLIEPDALVPQIVKICILLIAQDLERRPGLIEGVRSTFSDFP